MREGVACEITALERRKEVLVRHDECGKLIGSLVSVVSGHDADTLNRFTKVTDGELAGLVATIGANGGAGTGRTK